MSEKMRNTAVYINRSKYGAIHYGQTGTAIEWVGSGGRYAFWPHGNGNESFYVPRHDLYFPPNYTPTRPARKKKDL